MAEKNKKPEGSRIYLVPVFQFGEKKKKPLLFETLLDLFSSLMKWVFLSLNVVNFCLLIVVLGVLVPEASRYLATIALDFLTALSILLKAWAIIGLFAIAEWILVPVFKRIKDKKSLKEAEGK